MQMTDSEIVKSYKEAKEKKKQIEILSQLNACDVAKIREILIANGVQFPGPKPKKVKEEKTEVVAVISRDAAILKDASTLPIKKAIPEFVDKVVQEQLDLLRKIIAKEEEHLAKLKAEEAELSQWFKSVKEV